MRNKRSRLDAHAVCLERPPFGQFVRQVAPITCSELAEALEHQRQHGGRVGEILRDRGLLNDRQIAEVLMLQARWVAANMQAEMAPSELPYPTFLSLCMPAYNEEENIESCLDAACAILPEFVERFEVIVVDDGSRDDTGDLVASYAQRHECVRLVQHEKNRGYGAAVTTGLKSAQGDLVIFTDSDGQFSLLDLPQLLMHLDDHDVVLGYRHCRADVGMRRLNAWSWNQLVRLILKVCVRDLDCAFKLFRREIIDGLQLTSTGACINAEILVQCTQAKLRMCEIPVKHYPRHHGAPTGAALRVIMRAFRELPELRKYLTNPTPLVSVAGHSPRVRAVKVDPVLTHAKAKPIRR